MMYYFEKHESSQKKNLGLVRLLAMNENEFGEQLKQPIITFIIAIPLLIT